MFSFAMPGLRDLCEIEEDLCTGCPRKNATDLKISNGNCFILIIKRLFLLKSAMIRMNFDIFSVIFRDLVLKLRISKLQNYPYVKTRATALAILNYSVIL